MMVGLVFADDPDLVVRPEDEYFPPSSPAVRERLEWLQDQKLCLMMHFGLYSVLGIVESWPLSTDDGIWARADIAWTKDDSDLKRQYYATSRCFNPVKFNATEWVQTAKRCGFRYVAFTTKHHDGFCLWDTQYTDYKTTDPSCPYSSNPNADIVKKLFDACRAEGLGISAYFSKADFHHPDYWENCGIGYKTRRQPTYSTKEHPEKWERFRTFTKNQMLELVRRYGPIDALWLDGGWINAKAGLDLDIKGIIDEARQVNPGLISVDRGVKGPYTDIRTPEQCVPEKPMPYPWESCITMSDSWGYHYDDTYKDVRTLVHLIVDVVSKGGNLALNVGPAPDGTLPRPALERMEAIGKWMAKHGAAIYATRPVKPYSFDGWCFTKGKDGRIFAIRKWDAGTRRLDHVPLTWMPGTFGRLAKVTHLASGCNVRFSFVNRIWSEKYQLDLPKGFERDEYADAFVLECARPGESAAEEIPALARKDAIYGPKDNGFRRHQKIMEEIARGGAKVVFLGDSITQFWESRGKKQMEKHFSEGDRRMLNLGYSMDRTECVLWRITKGGELDGYLAKVVVMMIGTNNAGHRSLEKEPPEDTARAIGELVRIVREKQPGAIVVLHGIIPRGESADDPCRIRNERVNALISSLADGKTVFWCDFGERLVDEKGDTKALLPDRLHPNDAGYAIWAEEVGPYVDYALSDGRLPRPKNRFRTNKSSIRQESDQTQVKN